MVVTSRRVGETRSLPDCVYGLKICRLGVQANRPRLCTQELVQVLSDAYVVLDWDDPTLANKLLPMSATHRGPPGDTPREVRRACIELLAAALAWSEFRCAHPVSHYSCFLV